MFRRVFLKLLLFTSACVPQLYGYNYAPDPHSSLGSGFLVGGYATFHSFYFHTKDLALDTAGDPADQNLWEYDSTQRAPGGGGFVGYGISFCERFTLALKAAATGYSSEANHSDYDGFLSDFFPNKMKVKYIVDLCLEPGAKLGNCLLLYAKFGPSYVGWKQAREINEENGPSGLGKDKQCYHNWGYAFGTGINALITKCISAFIEFDGHSYPINNSQKRVVDSTNPNEFYQYRTTRLYGFGFKFGLMAGF
ncbi:MAG: hypothetical protein WAM28_05195 [Chlamydiales bacterium]